MVTITTSKPYYYSNETTVNKSSSQFEYFEDIGHLLEVLDEDYLERKKAAEQEALYQNKLFENEFSFHTIKNLAEHYGYYYLLSFL